VGERSGEPLKHERRSGIRRPEVGALVASLVLVLAGGCTESSELSPLEATIPELQRAMEAGQLTSVELVDFYLARTAAYDRAGPKLSALILVNPAARDEAAALDAERVASGPRGPLHGIPVILKDNIGTADLPTTAGSLALKGFTPARDAFQVRKLREAGAVVIGKANLFEFALGWTTVSSLGGQTLNPYDSSRDPGGSSGGTAVAVTANFAAAGLGTDTCGSIRLPAAHNDLYGLRPTSGLSSRAGVIPLSTTLDAVGPMARSVVDLAIVLDATAGRDPADPTTVPVRTSYLDAVDPDGLSGRRIGLVTFSGDPDVEGVIGSAIEEMTEGGVEVVDVTLPSAADIGPFFGEFRFALGDYLATEPTAPVRSLDEIVDLNVVTPAVGGFLLDLAAVTSLDTVAHRTALDGRRPFRDAVVALMDEQDLDAIAYPASSSPAAPVGGDPSPFDCASAAAGGLPAMVVPAGFTSQGLPVGLELMGRPFSEPTLIAIAAGWEAHTEHRMLPPATPSLELTE
jgi:Asp-tRNA(Asn)/Glu-tRNA(Gln) amidotransferase A subunit family amidase